MPSPPAGVICRGGAENQTHPALGLFFIILKG
jgi:hypothetical protein